MNLFLRPFHIFRWKVIHRFDPAAFFLQRTLRTLAALGISAWIFHSNPEFMLWAALAPIIMSWAREGRTLGARKATMAATCLFSAALVIPSTVLGASTWGITLFLGACTFLGFYLGGLGPAFGAAGKWSLFFCVLGMAQPDTWITGCIRACVVVAGGACAYAAHFLIFPVRPKRVVQTLRTMALDDLDRFFRGVCALYENSGPKPARLESLSHRAQFSVEALLSFSSVLHVSPQSQDGPVAQTLSLGMDLERLYENILGLWSLEKSASPFPLFAELRPDLSLAMAHARDHLTLVARGVRKKEVLPGTRSLDQALENLEQHLRAQLAARREEFPIQQWVFAFNVLYTLKAVRGDLGRADREAGAAELGPFVKPRLRGMGLRQKLRENFSLQSEVLRSAVQAAAATSGAAFLVKYLGLPRGYWVVLFVVVALKPNMGASIESGKKRLWGTVLGVGLAAGFLAAGGQEGALFYSVGLLSFFLMLYLMHFPHFVFSITVSTFSVVLFMAWMAPPGWETGLVRLWSVCLALAIGLTASVLIWPNRALRRLNRELAGTLESQEDLYRSLTRAFVGEKDCSEAIKEKQEAAKKALVQCQATYDSAVHEPGARPSTTKVALSVLLHEKRLLEILLSLEGAAARPGTPGFKKEFGQVLLPFFEKVGEAFVVNRQHLKQGGGNPEPLPVLKKAALETEDRFSQLRESGTLAQMDPDDRMQLYTIFTHARGLARELVRMGPDVEYLGVH